MVLGAIVGSTNNNAKILQRWQSGIDGRFQTGFARGNSTNLTNTANNASFVLRHKSSRRIAHLTSGRSNERCKFTFVALLATGGTTGGIVPGRTIRTGSICFVCSCCAHYGPTAPFMTACASTIGTPTDSYGDLACFRRTGNIPLGGQITLFSTYVY